MSELHYLERAASAGAEGLLVLHHGRGTDERDLLPLADALDPDRRLHVVSPRGPLTLPGAPGRHWYLVPRVGTPDPRTFHASYAMLASLHDALWERLGLGPERTVLGGFSMGCVMSYALGLGGDRPVPAGILALSGFIPAVEGWRPEPQGRRGLPVLIAHGSRDPVIPVDFARSARDALVSDGLDVSYHENELGHQVDPALLPLAASWLGDALAGGRPPRRDPPGG